MCGLKQLKGFLPVLTAAALAGLSQAACAYAAELPAVQPAPSVTMGGAPGASLQPQPSGGQAPEAAADTIRTGGQWTAAQALAPTHQLRISLFGEPALAAIPPAPPFAAGFTPPYAFLALTSNSYGFAGQGGLQLNADYLSPGDKLWLQAAYDKGALGSFAGDKLAAAYGPAGQSRYMGSGLLPEPYIAGWNPQINSDCMVTRSGTCEQQPAWSITGAYKHYWLPILSSAIYGSYLEVHYPANVLESAASAAGVSNPDEPRAGTGPAKPPVKGFDIGAEFMYGHLNQTPPAVLAPNPVITTNGLPASQPDTNVYEGRLRLQRAF
jgi:hypothetical protein